MSPIRLTILPYLLRFRQPAGTSRGVYTVRKVWYLLLSSDEHPERRGIGECAPLPDLSSDLTDDYESVLTESCRWTEKNGCIDMEALRAYPSILFGLETAFRQYEKHSFSLWDTPFSQGRQGIPINGLIWMGEYREMLRQIEKKLE